MPERRLRWFAAVSGVTLALSMTSCNAPSTEPEWSLSVAAPERFKVKHDDVVGIDLPISLDGLTAYMLTAGSDGYSVQGDGELVPAPRPRPDALCKGTSKAVIYVFPTKERFGPGYLAYVDANGMVDCVENYFSYLAF